MASLAKVIQEQEKMERLVKTATAYKELPDGTQEPIPLWHVNGMGRLSEVVIKTPHVMGYAKIRYGSWHTTSPRIYWCRIVSETETAIQFQPITKNSALSLMELEQGRGLTK